ncbi:hypothetical protein BC941DRAFT_335144, partial [Chlamydoabsidia padenii]
NKKQRVMAADVQWCINNRNTLTMKSFINEFGILDKNYAVSRYTSIISNRHLAEDRQRLE